MFFWYQALRETTRIVRWEAKLLHNSRNSEVHRNQEYGARQALAYLFLTQLRAIPQERRTLVLGTVDSFAATGANGN